MTMTVRLEFPEGLDAALGAAGYTPERLSEEARRQLAAALFARKVLSLGQAAELAGMSLWDFIPFLGQQGIPYIDYDEDETRKEMEAAECLAKKLRG
jgi:predicted HTH domain antitoxin